MISKGKEKTKAIQLRKAGLSYNEILKRLPVAKSTLSVWLRDIGLAKKHQQRFTQQRRMSQKKAQEACRLKRILKEKAIFQDARLEINQISDKELLLIGTILYWAEGSKQKDHNVSQCVSLGNSDPRMILLFIRWLKKICKCTADDMVYSLYIHESGDIERAKIFWEQLIGDEISWIYLKKHNPKTNRKNIQENYYGLLRVNVRRSTDLNRKIKGWVLGIIDTLNISIGE